MELGEVELDFVGWGGGGGPGHIYVCLEVGDSMVDVFLEEIASVEVWHTGESTYDYKGGK